MKIYTGDKLSSLIAPRGLGMAFSISDLNGASVFEYSSRNGSVIDKMNPTHHMSDNYGIASVVSHSNIGVDFEELEDGTSIVMVEGRCLTLQDQMLQFQSCQNLDTLRESDLLQHEAIFTNNIVQYKLLHRSIPKV